MSNPPKNNDVERGLEAENKGQNGKKGNNSLLYSVSFIVLILLGVGIIMFATGRSETKDDGAVVNDTIDMSSDDNNVQDDNTQKARICVLPKLTEEMVGKPVWVQTGQVMTFFNQNDSTARKTYTDESPTITENDQYMVKCLEPGFFPDELCFYTCTDGVLDTTTYCQTDPHSLCVKQREASINKQCPLDFDTDESFFDGKSLKTWWKEVLDKYHFARNDIFSLNSTMPIYLGHGAANLEGAGVAIQDWLIPDFDKEFNADAVHITSWVSKDYEYGNDTLRGSTSASQKGFIQDLVTEDIQMGPFAVPNVTAPFPTSFKPTLALVSMLRDYDPCDDSDFLGFPPECFIYHPAGFHVGSGEMVNFRSPLDNGNIDLLGHCTGAETGPPILMNALASNLGNLGDETIANFGGFITMHPAIWSMHLCVDDDDIYHPYLCSVHQNQPKLTEGSEFVPIDAAPFMPMPTKMRKKLCADRVAAGPDLCRPNNDTNYPYPWTQFL